MRDDLISDALGIASANTASTDYEYGANQSTVKANTVATSIVTLPMNNLPLVNQTDDEDQKADYDRTRKTYEVILEKGKEALNDLHELALDANSIRDAARAYEVMGGIMKSMNDATERMYDIHKKKKELKGVETSGTVTNNIDKAVFVGTTEDLVRQLRNVK